MNSGREKGRERGREGEEGREGERERRERKEGEGEGGRGKGGGGRGKRGGGRGEGKEGEKGERLDNTWTSIHIDKNSYRALADQSAVEPSARTFHPSTHFEVQNHLNL